MKKRYPFLLKNWLRVGLAAAIFTSFSFDLKAQNGPVKQWDKTFGGSAQDELHSLQQTTDGGYILGGWSASGISGEKSQSGKGDRDYWIVKLDANGTKLWDKTYGGNFNDEFTSLKQTSDGGYILGGMSRSSINGDKTQASRGDLDYWIVKLDASGNKSWDKAFGGSNGDLLLCLQQTSDGGYILGGRSNSSISGDKTQASQGAYDYWIVKLDASGNKSWDKTYGGSSGDGLNSLQQTLDGGYILGGFSNSPISGDKTQVSKGTYDYWILKLDSGGNKIWDQTFGGNGYDEPYSLQQTLDGGYIVGGWSASDITGDKSEASKGLNDFWVLKLDANGSKIWDRTFGGNNYDNLFSLQQTPDLGYILGGFTSSGISGDKTQATNGGDDFWAVKINASGNKIWDKTLGGISSDGLTSLQYTTDGGYILGGMSYSGISGDKTQPCRGNYDFWVVKLAADITGIKESKASLPVSISPNPNQGKFSLQLSNLNSPTAEVTISDLLGRVVLQKEIQATNNQISEELTLPNAKGIYLLQLKAGEQIITRKIVVE